MYASSSVDEHFTCQGHTQVHGQRAIWSTVYWPAGSDCFNFSSPGRHLLIIAYCHKPLLGAILPALGSKHSLGATAIGNFRKLSYVAVTQCTV